MPELPDVEVFRRRLAHNALHRRIRAVHTSRLRDLSGASLKRLTSALRRRRFERTDRHGKYLFAGLDSDDWLVLHFGMTGSLSSYRDGSEKPDHTRLLVDFADGSHLAYQCQRLFGRVDVTKDPDEFSRKHELGPDALGLKKEILADLFDGRRGSIKSALMDQSLLAGIGNVYSDEMLFQAKIHPASAAAALDAKALGRLWRSMRHVLRTAIDRRADPASFPDSWLTPRRGEKGPCPRCDGALRSTKISGRTAWYCPSCQRKYSPR